jgi:hypothetical protein
MKLERGLPEVLSRLGRSVCLCPHCCRRHVRSEPRCSDETNFFSMLPATTSRSKVSRVFEPLLLSRPRGSDPAEHTHVDPRIPIRSWSSSSDQRHPGRPQQTHLSCASSLDDRIREDRVQACRLSNAQHCHGHGTNRTDHTIIPDPNWAEEDRAVLVPYTTMAKGRWLGREMLEVVSTEFRDRSIDYYASPSNFLSEHLTNNAHASTQRYALESGVTTINGEIAKPDTIIRNGDRIEFDVFLATKFPMRLNLWPRNVVHRHEPPVTAKPVKIIHHDAEREFIVIDKPGSIVSRSLAV